MVSKEQIAGWGMVVIIVLYIIFFSMGLVSAKVYEASDDILISKAVRIGGAPSSSILCNITLEDPNSFVIINYQPMINNATTQRHEYYLMGSNTSDLSGEYCYELSCSANGLNETRSFCDIEITPDGSKPNTSQGIIYSGVVLISFVFFIICLIWAFTTEKKYLKLGLGMFSYLLFNWLLFVLWQLSYNYLNMAGLASILRIFFWITTVSLFPAFIFAFLITLREIKNDRFTQNLLKRGLPER